MALTAAKKAAATTNTPSLSCPSSVTRGQSLTARVSHLGEAKIKWEFLDGGSVTVTKTKGDSWSGVMVTSGTIRATITPLKGEEVVKECAVSVKNRSGWAFSAVAPKKKANGYSCGGGTTLNAASPPRQSGDALGRYCVKQFFSFTTATVDGGPNDEYKYLTAMNNSFGSSVTEYSWVISPDLEDTTSAFYRAQCGNYNPQTGDGYISGANLKANTIRHESGSVESHYAHYKAAQDKPENNLGIAGEQQVGKPSVTKKKFEEMMLNPELEKRGKAILEATDEEPCDSPSVNYNASCVYQGLVNFSSNEVCEE